VLDAVAALLALLAWLAWLDSTAREPKTQARKAVLG
jgi:hypothetical protein